jgi:hypothetical protein
MGLVYPYLACATVSNTSEFWNQLVEVLSKLETKFKQWYGDQEAMKIWAKK